MFRYGLCDDVGCVLCGKEEDDVNNLFFKCEFSFEVSELICYRLKVRQQVRNLEEW